MSNEPKVQVTPYCALQMLITMYPSKALLLKLAVQETVEAMKADDKEASAKGMDKAIGIVMDFCSEAPPVPTIQYYARSILGGV